MSIKTVSVQVTLTADVKTVWQKFTNATDIEHWYFASADWQCKNATNNLTKNGIFSWLMEAKDGSFGFNYTGIYTAVEPYKYFAYKLADERKVIVEFKEENEFVTVIETFDTENENPIEMQIAGWQAILNNFKEYVETK